MVHLGVKWGGNVGIGEFIEPERTSSVARRSR
jgi:hypothetical protein